MKTIHIYIAGSSLEVSEKKVDESLFSTRKTTVSKLKKETLYAQISPKQPQATEV